MNPPLFFKHSLLWLLGLMFCVAASFSSQYLSADLLTPYEFFFLGLLVIFISVALFRQASAGHLCIPLLLLPIIVFIILRIAPVFFSPVLNLHSALSKTAGLLIGAFFFLSLHQAGFSAADRRRIMVMIFLSGVVQSFIGAGQFFLPGLDLSPLLMKFKGTAYGSFQQPNLMASWLATCIVISLYLTLNDWIDSFSRMRRMIFIALTAAPCFVLPLTGSRTGLLGLVVGMSLIWLSRKELVRQKARHLQIWLCILIISFSLGVVSSYIVKGESSLIYKTAKTRLNDMAGRSVLYSVGIDMFLDSPAAGHGIGDFSSLYPLYETRKFKDNLDDSKRMYGSLHPHNELIYQLAESGIIGTVGLFFVSGCFVFYLLRLGIKTAAMFIGLLSPLIIHLMLEYPFYQSLPHYALFIVLLYLLSSQFRNRICSVNSKFTQSMLRIIIITAAILSVVFVSSTLYSYMKMAEHVRLKARAGVVQIKLLDGGLKNPYLAKYALRLKMAVLLDYALTKYDKKMLLAVSQWALDETRKEPLSVYYEIGVRALIASGRLDDALFTANRAIAIYPFMTDRLKNIYLPMNK